MPTGTIIALLAIIASITIPALAAYGKLRDEMATLRSQIIALRSEDERNARDITHEAQRNDAQDGKLSTMADTLSRIDTNVQRLVDTDNALRRAQLHG